jgi:hypothetical protein
LKNLDTLRIEEAIEYLQQNRMANFDQYCLDEHINNGKLTPYFFFNGVLCHSYLVCHPQDSTQSGYEEMYFQYAGYVSQTDIHKSICLSNQRYKGSLYLSKIKVLTPQNMEYIDDDLDYYRIYDYRRTAPPINSDTVLT